jgi:hypothetical protein
MHIRALHSRALNKRAHIILLTATLLGVAGRSAWATAITWTNTAGGNWSAASNWEPNQVPTAGDDASIVADGIYTVTVDTAATFNTLTVGGNSGVQTVSSAVGTSLTIGTSAAFNSLGFLNLVGGTIKGAGTLTLAGTNSWVAGTFADGGLITIAPTGLLQVGSGNDHYFSGTTWNNLGTVAWSAGSLRGGNAIFTNANIFLQEPNGYEIDNDGAGPLVIYNTGTWTMTNNSGGSSIIQGSCYLVNSGLVDVASGTLDINGGGTNTSTGRFNVALNAVCEFTVSYTFNNNSTFTGAGSMLLNAGNQTYTFDGNIVTTNLQWVAGFIAGTLTNIAGNTLYIDSGNDHWLPNMTFDNKGTVAWSAGSLRGGNTSIYNEGLWLQEVNGYEYDNAGGGTLSYYNTGTLRSTNNSGGTTTFQGNCLLLNSGLVDVADGTLQLNGGGTNNSPGTFNAAAGAACNFNVNYTFNDGSTFEGGGTVELDAGSATYTFGGNIVTTNLQWVAGFIAGNLTNIAGNTLYIDSGNDHWLPNATLDNKGTVRWTEGNLRGAGNIFNEGLWLDGVNGYEFDNAGSGTQYFYNTGTLRETNNSGGTTTFQANALLINSGLVDVGTGTLSINSVGTNTGSGVFNADSGAACNFNASYYFLNGSTFEGAGTVEIDGGGSVYTFTGDINTTNLQWYAGTITGTLTNLPGNNLFIVSGNDHFLENAILDNQASVTWVSGNLRAGSSTVYNRNLWLNETPSGYELDISPSGTSYFNNIGTLRRTTAGVLTFQPNFLLVNTGLVDAQTGTIAINDAGGTNNGGTFSAELGAAVLFNNHYTFNEGSTFVGAGTVELASGGVVYNFNGDIVTTNLQWFAGTISGTLTNLPGNNFYIVSGNDHFLSNATLDNKGTVTWIYGNLRVGSSAVYNRNLWLNETPSGYEMDISPSGASPFYNIGTFQRTNTSGVLTIQPGFYLINSGLVDVETGTLSVNDGGGANNGGTFNAAASSSISFFNQYTFNDGSTFTGAGASFLQSSTGVTFNGGFNSANLQWFSGTVGGKATNNPGSTFYIVSGNDHVFPSAYIKNLGTVVHQQGNLRGGSTVDNNGLWQEEASSGYEYDNYGAGTLVFNNIGTFVKSASGSTPFQNGTTFTNIGTLEVVTGSITFNGVYNQDQGTMLFGVSGTGSGNYGSVGISSPLAINGTLGLALQGGFTPALGNSFTPITSTADSSQFNDLNLPAVPSGDAWSVNYNPANVTLTVVAFGATNSSIFGSVKDAPTHGVPNISVFAFSGSNPTTYVSTTTDANGNYVLGVTNATWTVGLSNLTAAGYSPVADQMATTSGGSPNQEVDFLIKAIGATAPAATTTAASFVTSSAAQLNGTVNPDGEAVSVYFEYGVGSLNQFTPTNTLTANLNSVQLQGIPVSGLAPGTQYQFQIVAQNSFGTTLGGVQSFTTLGLAPVVVTEPATDIGTTNATINGTVNPGGLATTYYFEYGTNTSYGNYTPTNSLAAGNSVDIVTNALTNLQPATVYHYQLVASNGVSITLGGDLTFTNQPAPPTVTTLAAFPVDVTDATLNGSINPNGLDTSWYFEYGTDPSFGHYTPTNVLTGTNVPSAVSSMLSGLQANLTYYFQLVGSNSLGTNLGGVLTFTTGTTGAKITCPADITVGTASGECGQTVAFAATATGNPAPTITYTYNGSPITSPSFFPIGTNVVISTAQNSGGMDTCSFNVIVSDSQPPLAGPNSLGTYEGKSASVAVAKMLARDKSQRGNPLSITSVSPTTALHGSASLSGGLIQYVPPASTVGQDTITYTLSDGCGTTNGTITVTILSTNLPAMNLVSATPGPGSVTLVFAGIPGDTYVVQSAPTPSGPWTNLSPTIVAAPNGLVQYTDVSPPPVRFYRMLHGT